jgi:hypothetical protein
MAKNKKWKNKSNKIIPEPNIPDEKIKFSFKYYDVSGKKYCISCESKKNIAKALSCLREISQKTYNEISNNRRTYRFHSVDWNETTEKSGFPDTETKELNAYQFSLVGVNSSKARIFGVYAENVFNIVWFDWEHKIYLNPLKNT